VADDKYIQSLLYDARVARLSTIDFKEQKPHVVPVVFVFDGDYYYVPIDEKTKRHKDPEQLRRVRNIQKNPNVAILIDEYNEDWSKLFFVMIQGKGLLIGRFVNQNDLKKMDEMDLARKEEPLVLQHKRITNIGYLLKNAHNLLLEKYPQYQKIGVGQRCIMICPEKTFTWKMNTGKQDI
jgi:PPOX class probable F420-dependent enzyme